MKLRHLCAMAAALVLGLSATPVLAMDFTEFQLPTPLREPGPITVGADGNLWFIESMSLAGNQSRIGRMTTGGVLTEFIIPTLRSQPAGITTGPDGNVWFTGGLVELASRPCQIGPEAETGQGRIGWLLGPRSVATIS
jgi:streptogramin lyase